MGQQLFKVHLGEDDPDRISADTIRSTYTKEDVGFLFSSETWSAKINSVRSNKNYQAKNSEFESIQQLRKALSALIKQGQSEQTYNEINDILMKDVISFLTDQTKKINEELDKRLSSRNNLKQTLMKQIQVDGNFDTIVCADFDDESSLESQTESRTDNDDNEPNRRAKQESKQLSYYAIQSLVSVLLVLIRSVEKTDSEIIHQILALTGQLCDQMPLRIMSSIDRPLLTSLKPIISYMHELSTIENQAISKHAIKIMIYFSMGTACFKDVLCLLGKLMFNTNEVYNFQAFLAQLNNNTGETIRSWKRQKQKSICSVENNDNQLQGNLAEPVSINFLKNIGAYPNAKLLNLNEKLFTGQFISSIILSHIDIENEINPPSQQSQPRSIAFDLHANTFNHLFTIIEQLTNPSLLSSPLNDTIIHNVNICLRLFTSHLQVLLDIQFEDSSDSLSNYIDQSEVKNWFDLLLRLVCNENFQHTTISNEASKSLMKIILIQKPSFPERLQIMYQYISENKYLGLVKEFLIELNKNETLLNWIDAMLQNEKIQSSLLPILYSFFDLCFNRNDEQKALIQQILSSFQQFLLSRIMNQQLDTEATSDDQKQLSFIIIQYLTYIFKSMLQSESSINPLFDSILVGLYVMTEVNEPFSCETRQQIFTNILPLLIEYYLKNVNHERHIFICDLIGRISNILITGAPKDSLETSHISQLKSPVFAGGCMMDRTHFLLSSNLANFSQYQLTYDMTDNNDFLLSIFNNIDDGARLITKLKSFVKAKERLLPSIEQQANDACAAVFAVYVKFYRRTNLAKWEIQKQDTVRPHDQVIKVYEYSRHVCSLFSTVKAQGGDCDELLNLIKLKALFLLSSIRENNFISTITEDTPPIAVHAVSKPTFEYQRQRSKWSQAKHVITLLRNIFQACIRFKKIMLKKKRLPQQNDNIESLLHRGIDNFLYEDLYKSLTSINIDEQTLKLNEIGKCIRRQQDRALLRLMTYQCVKKFLEKLINQNDKEISQKLLSVFLPYLRNSDLDWSCFDNILGSNCHVKDEITHCYYSIIKLVLPTCLSSRTLSKSIFYLLNTRLESADLCQLYQHQLTETLFTSIVCYTQTSQLFSLSLDIKLLASTWFRILLLTLCESIEIEKRQDTFNEILQKQQKLIFNTLFLNELKQQSMTQLNITTKMSLQGMTFRWFTEMNNSSIDSSQPDIELYKIQYLVTILECFHRYKHTLTVCSHVDYLTEFLHIYEHSRFNVTRLLSIKILRYLIPNMAQDNDETSGNRIKNFLNDVLQSIGEHSSLPPEITAELIYMYRTIMSMNAPWQAIAKDLVLDSIQLYLNLESVERNDKQEMNRVLAALCILGEYIEPYRLGSMVSIQSDKKSYADHSLALIVKIESNVNESTTPYLIQYIHTNEIERVSIDKLKTEIDVSPPILSDIDDSILDALGHFIVLDTSTTQSLVLLQLKRCSLSVLYHIISSQQLVTLFVTKPYASALAKLCFSNVKSNQLDILSKENLGKSLLQLDLCEKSSIPDENESQSSMKNLESINDPAYSIWNTEGFKPDQFQLNIFSLPALQKNMWKPYVSEMEMEMFKEGRIGRDDISIVSLPSGISTSDAITECGNNHRFRGRIFPDPSNTQMNFPTYIIENLEFSTGKWYYCIRLPVGGVVQVGWGTHGMAPTSMCGVGDDKYSWSYDGSRAAAFHQEEISPIFNNLRWGSNDVCGCGIEIDGNNTNIKYWLNGKLLGTPFIHNEYIEDSFTLCDLMPNGSKTTYFPSVTIQIVGNQKRSCELIFSPDDMHECPLPNGYKPLILPKLIPKQIQLVDYPLSAYLLGENPTDYFCRTRTNTSDIFLRDFVSEHHLQTSYNVVDHHIVLPEHSTGFPIRLNNDHRTSVTISFDFELSSSNENLEFCLFKFNSIEMKLKNIKEKIHCAILFLIKKCHIKVYVNSKCRLYTNAFDLEAIKQLNIDILPVVEARMKNLAIWKYALSEENIRYLFTYNLPFIAVEYRQLTEFRKRVNKISFAKTQQHFIDEHLFAFNEPFKEDIWKRKKIQMDDNESQYFKTKDEAEYSVIELYGNKSYLVLEKPNETWENYTLIIQILIPELPTVKEKLTLIALNHASEISVTHEGFLHLEMNQVKIESESKVMLQEYFNLCVSVAGKRIDIYVNDSLQISMSRLNMNHLQIKSNRIDFFREANLRKNTTDEHKLRIAIQSVTYLNRWTPADCVSSSTLTQLPFLMVASNLMCMGYKKAWIALVMEEHNTENISTIHKILVEQKDQLLSRFINHEREHYLKIVSNSNPLMNQETLKDLMYWTKFDTYEHKTQIIQKLFPQWIRTQISTDSNADKSFELNDDKEWFSNTVRDLGIDTSIEQWMADTSSVECSKQDTFEPVDFSEIDEKREGNNRIASLANYSTKQLSNEEFLTCRISHEYALITIYARYTIFNMIDIYLQNRSSLFPLEKLGDYPFVIALLKLLDHVKSGKGDNENSIDLLIKSALKAELKTMCEVSDSINHDSLQTKAPLIYCLQRDVFTQAIHFSLKSSLLHQDFNEQGLNFGFLLKILKCFVTLIKDSSIILKNQSNLLSALLFPEQFINLMFDLFLLVPAKEAKITIINQFRSLLELNNNFVLNDRIQQFIFHLLNQMKIDVEFSKSNRQKHFQTALADLVYIILKKRNSQSVEQDDYIESAMPEHIGNLFKAIHVILAWTDPNKEQPLPDFFLQKSSEILGDNLGLNQEDFITSNHCFHAAADRELIDFMNQDSFFSISCSEFIEQLPRDHEPNSVFYNKYPSLCKIPANIISIRAQFLLLLNSLIQETIQVIDASLPPGRSFLADQMRKMKPYLLSSVKFELFNDTLSKTEISCDRTWTIVQFDIINADDNSNQSEHTMFYQAFQQLHHIAHTTFRRSDEQLWRAQYVGMHSTDQGGPYRDCITRICADICSNRLPLFIQCPNARTNVGLNRDCWIPNVFPPNQPIDSNYKRQYRFVGQLFGMAMRKKHYLNVKFAPVLWKQLLKEPTTIEDIEAIDIQSFTAIRETGKYLEQIKSIEGDNDIGSLFSSIMSELRFDVVSSSGEAYELIPGGKDISITSENFEYYCSCYEQYRLNEFSRQVDSIREGLFSVIPCYYFDLFTAYELEAAVCGKGSIDIEVLKRNTNYAGDYNSESPVIERFWTVLSDMFNDDQRKLLLVFVWGRSTLPIRDEDFEMKFTINSLTIYEDDCDKVLPQSHTCFFALDLPPYTTADIMYERLNYAITSCGSIDGDGLLNPNIQNTGDDLDSNSSEEQNENSCNIS